MSILNGLYNWLAMRNIGEALGLRWDPEKDSHYQQRRLRERASDWLETLEMELASLSSATVERAGNRAYSALASFPDPITPEIIRVHELANSIISSLPPTYKPPPPRPRLVQARVAADQALASLKHAQLLVDQGRYKDAHAIIGDVLSKRIFTHGGVDRLEVTVLAGTLNARIWPHIKDEPL